MDAQNILALHKAAKFVVKAGRVYFTPGALEALTVITSRLENPNPEVETYFNEFSNLVDDVHEKAAFAKNKGGYSSLEVADNQLLIKYSGHLDSLFPNYSYHQIVNEMSDEELRTHFKGKIILLGTNDSDTAKDEIPVIGNPNLHGVKLLALATSQLPPEMETDEAPIRRTLPSPLSGTNSSSPHHFSRC